MDEQKIRILLVEDEEAHVELIRRAFRDTLYVDRCLLTVVSSLADARGYLNQHSAPDLIIADMVLPDGCGTELLQAETETMALKREQRFPLVIMTSHGDEQIAVNAMKAGALDYVVKSAAALADMPRVAERALREWGHIIERQQAEDALRESEQRYRMIVEDMPALIRRFLPDGTLTFVNEHYCWYFNRRREELEGHSFFDLLPLDEADEVREHYAYYTSLTPKNPVVTYEHRALAGRERRWQRWTDRALFDEQGQMLECQSVGIDITQHKQTERALRLYSERLETLHEIDQAILAAESPVAIAQAALARMGQLINCPAGTVMVVDLEGDEAQVLATLVAGQVRETSGARFPLTILSHLETYRQGKVHVVDDTQAVSQLSSAEQVLRDRRIRSYLSVPLMIHEQFIGLLVLGAYQTRAFTPEHVEVAREAARSLAIAIQQRQLRKKLEQRTAQVEAALQEKEILLQEVHHRVKNNLQVISSLLNLQSEHVKDKRALGIFADSRDRVQSMALVHEALYQSPDLAQVLFSEYVQVLTSYLLRAYGIGSSQIRLKTEVQDVALDIDTAVSCGLIINELVSNALKHAFPAGGGGEIHVGLRAEAAEYKLVVADNGVGVAADLNLHNPASLGLQLVNTLVDQLEGTIALDRSGGSTFQITFPDPEHKNEQ